MKPMTGSQKAILRSINSIQKKYHLSRGELVFDTAIILAVLERDLEEVNAKAEYLEDR